MTTDSSQTQLDWLRPGQPQRPLGHWSSQLRDGARVGAGPGHGLTPILDCTPHTNTGNSHNSWDILLKLKYIIQFWKSKRFVFIQCRLNVATFTLRSQKIFSPNMLGCDNIHTFVYLIVHSQQLDRMVDRVKPWFMGNGSGFCSWFCLWFCSWFSEWSGAWFGSWFMVHSKILICKEGF